MWTPRSGSSHVTSVGSSWSPTIARSTRGLYPARPMADPGDNRPKLDSESVTVVPSMSVFSTGEEMLSVLVLSQDFIAIYSLPESGEVTIGRSNSVEIYVD